jgi:streptogramin lyase
MSPKLLFRFNLGRELAGDPVLTQKASATFRVKPVRLFVILACVCQILALNAVANAQTALVATNFGSVNVLSTSSQTVTYTFSGAVTLGNVSVLTGGASGLDYANAGTGTCLSGTNYISGNSCTVNVTFTPKLAGTRYGAVVLDDNSANVVATLYLQGTGIGPQVSFLPGTESVVTSNLALYADQVGVDGSGNIYIADTFNQRVLKETFSGGGYTESVLPTSASYPYSAAVDGAGNIYVADAGDSKVFKETPSGSGYVETTVPTNPLGQLLGVKVDGNGDVYLTDWANNAVLEETLTASGYVETTIPTSSLNNPNDVAVDGSGNVYIADTGNDRILKETLSGSTYTETTLSTSGLDYPIAIAVDGTGNVYIDGVSKVLKETPSAGGYTQSILKTSAVASPYGVVVDGAGNVYISDGNNSRLLKEDYSDPPSLSFAATSVGSTSSDSPKTVTINNYGNSQLKFSAISFPADFPENSSATKDCTSTKLLASTKTCTLTINFTPLSSSSPLSENVMLTTNTLNVPGTQQAIAVTGTVIAPPAGPAVFSPSPGTFTSSQSVTISDSASGATIYYTTDGSTPTTSSSVYSGAITVNSSETIRAIATAKGYSKSKVVSGTYSKDLKKPVTKQ